MTFNLYPPEGQNILPGMTCTVLLRQTNRVSSQPTEQGVFQVPVRAVSTAEERARYGSWIPLPCKLAVWMSTCLE